jgi:CubicO group peptidase (beta-lactamase class C family)
MCAVKNSSFPFPSARPEEVGFSSERLARIKPFLQKYIDQHKVPNLVTLVIRHGKVAHFDVQGYMDFESKTPATKDTIYRLYSNSKPITGVATMILYEEGKLNLDDPVSEYIPAFKNQVVMMPLNDKAADANPLMRVPRVPARRGITLRDCLRNTTGLPTLQRIPASFAAEYREAMEALGWYPGSKPLPDALKRLEALAKIPLMAQPGTEFEYHVGYPVISAVLEIIMGKTLEEFYQERIFKPLGMKDTSFYLPAAKLERFPTCYGVRREGQKMKLVVEDKPETSAKVKGPKNYFGGGGDLGGVLSTAADYSRFGQMLLNSGELDGVRILGRKSVELMTASHTGNIFIPMVGHGFGFGLGVGVHTGGSWRPIMRSIGAYGWGGAAGTTYFCDPKEDLIGVCFTQVLMHLMIPDNLYREDFERMVYQALI